MYTLWTTESNNIEISSGNHLKIKRNHLERIDDERLNKQVTHCAPRDRRSIGKPVEDGIKCGGVKSELANT